MVRGIAATAAGSSALLCLAAILSGLSACAASPEMFTEVVVVLRSDLSVPEQLDFVELRAVGPDGTEQRAAATLTETDGLPKSISLVHTGGGTEPLRVTVSGWKDHHEVVKRSASLAFVPGKQLVLDLWLLSSCLEHVCAEGTCTEHGCASDAVNAHALPELQGTVASIEGQYVPPPMPWDAGDAAALVDAASGWIGDAGADASIEDASTFDAGAGDAGGSLLEPPAFGLDGGLPGAGPRDGGSATDGGRGVHADGAFSHDARVPTTGCTRSADCLTRCLSAPARLKLIACACVQNCS